MFVASLSKELGLYATPVGTEANNHERPTHAFTYLQITNQTVGRKNKFIPSVKKIEMQDVWRLSHHGTPPGNTYFRVKS